VALLWQTPRTFSVNEVEVASYMNAVRDALTFLGNVPICNAVQATGQSVGSAAWTSLSLDSTVVDTYGGHSNTTNPSRYTSQVPGYYLLNGCSSFPSNSTGWRGARATKNGAAVNGGAGEYGANASGATVPASPTVLVYLNVGDYCETQGYQTSGSGLTTSVNSDANCALTAVWVHA
jgi:hypothetical protein